MIEVEEAGVRICSQVPQALGESLPLDECLGRYSVVDIDAVVAIPGFDNSAMDGYAVRADDACDGAVLDVVGEQAAGRDLGLVLESGEAIRIFTGAPMPKGADAVVMQEDVRRDGDRVTVVEGVSVGEFVRRRGSDLCEGQRILACGDCLTPQRIGLLASQGIAEVEVGGLPRVGVLTTGDELVPAGGELGSGQIFNSNGVMLASQVRRLMPGATRVRRYHASDERGELEDVVQRVLDENDVVIIAGGVSVGDRDLVKPVLEAAGVETKFWKVRMKPGKPFLFGTEKRGMLVFGLPGNPVSSFVTFEVLVAPALLRWMGAGSFVQKQLFLELSEEVENRGDRPNYVRGKISESGRLFVPVGGQQSNALNSLARADGVLRVEAGGVLEEGALVGVFPVA